jgi:glycosyltransferase involved in cell wall biosynthesis
MSGSVRLTAVLTHPVQYYAPWFRHIAAHCPEIDLTVLYAADPTPAQRGVGFGVGLEWDTVLTDGYRCRILRPTRAGESVHSDRFWGLHVAEIGAAVVDTRPDVVLLPGWHSVTLVRALVACRRARIPVLYRGDSHLGTRPLGWRGPVWAARTRWLLGRFDGYLSVGTRAREYLRAFRVDPCRIFDAPHAVDNDGFARAAAPFQTRETRAAARRSLGLDERAFVVLFVGKLEPKKRPIDLVEAMARVRPGASLLVVGAGLLEPACRERAERLGVRAVWTGFLNQSELGRVYAVADCLALPSDGSETWGLVVNEALATGLPVVVSDRVGCGPDLVTEGETGAISPMGDASALAAAIERVRALIDAGVDHGASCRARAARHGLDRATAGLAAACRAVTRARRQREARPAPRVVACCGGMVIVGGLERVVFELLRGLTERGAAVHCIVNTWGSDRIVPLVREIGAGCSPGAYRRRLERRPRNPLAFAAMAWDVLKTSAGLVRDARRHRATHVLVPDLVAVLRNAPALALLRLFRVRVIFPLANAPDPGAAYRRIWQWGVVPVVDQFVCNSAFTMRELLGHGVPPRAVSLIHPCAPRRAPAPPGSTRDAGLVIYVGQVIPGKGLDLLLDAVALLVAAGHDVRLDVVGDVDGWEPPGWRGYRARIRARAARPDLAGRVRFYGEREDVPALLGRAAVHCCPSEPEFREAFGIVNLEAKEAGIPSVVCPTGGLVELIEHGVDGWICAEASAAAIAEGIEAMIVNPVRLARAGEAARRSALRWSRERFASAWWAVFDDVQGRRA